MFAEKQKRQSIEVIKATAEIFLNSYNDIRDHSNTQVIIGNIDARLTLTACDTQLDAFLPSGSRVQGKTTVGIRCLSPRPWTLYVPATITTFSQILIANTPLRRGHIVAAGDISVQTRDASQLNNAYLTDTDDVIGKVLKKNLANNAFFTRAALAEPHIVHKGQHVDLQAGNEGLKVSVSAIALTGGALGQKIRVKNLSSNKIVEGTILASGAIKAD